MFENKVYKHDIDSPIGSLRISASDSAILSINFLDSHELTFSDINPIIEKCKDQLNKYFDGGLKEFDLSLAPEGSDFQINVWNLVSEVSYGETVSYETIALQIGDKNSVRAVGNANGKNPIPIIIPCYRIVGKNNDLTGYAGGLNRKQWLLSHEKFFSGSEKQLSFFEEDKIEFNV